MDEDYMIQFLVYRRYSYRKEIEVSKNHTWD